MKHIKTLDELSKEYYGKPFRWLFPDSAILIVRIQRNNIEIAKLELLSDENIPNDGRKYSAIAGDEEYGS